MRVYSFPSFVLSIKPGLKSFGFRILFPVDFMAISEDRHVSPRQALRALALYDVIAAFSLAVILWSPHF